MKKIRKCACSVKGAEPKDVKTETMVTPNDFGKIKKDTVGEVSEESVEESVVMINPDAESMNSRG